jgi:hypothetical protein
MQLKTVTSIEGFAAACVGREKMNKAKVKKQAEIDFIAPPNLFLRY